MKVLVISHTYIAPINREKWTTLAQLYNMVEITVIVPKKWPGVLFSHEAKDLSVDTTKNCTFIALDTFKAGNEMIYRYHSKQLYKLIASIKPDIIHVEQGDKALSYFQAIVFAKTLKLPTKFLFFTWINWKPKLSLKHRLFWNLLTRFNLRSTDGAIAGNAQAGELLRENGFAKPITVLPQIGVNHHRFIPAVKDQAKKYITYVGRMVEEKGIFLLLNAFAQLAAHFPSWHIRFIGSGPCKEALTQQAQQYAFHNKIEIGATSDHHQVVPILQKTDILVLPSYDTTDWREQFGHVLIEAMACGVAVIGSNAGEIPNVIADAGLIFEQKNERSLLAQLHALMQDEELRIMYGHKGRKRVELYYSHEAIAHQTYAYWQQLLSS